MKCFYLNEFGAGQTGNYDDRKMNKLPPLFSGVIFLKERLIFMSHSYLIGG